MVDQSEQNCPKDTYPIVNVLAWNWESRTLWCCQKQSGAPLRGTEPTEIYYSVDRICLAKDCCPKIPNCMEFNEERGFSIVEPSEFSSRVVASDDLSELK